MKYVSPRTASSTPASAHMSHYNMPTFWFRHIISESEYLTLSEFKRAENIPQVGLPHGSIVLVMGKVASWTKKHADVDSDVVPPATRNKEPKAEASLSVSNTLHSNFQGFLVLHGHEIQDDQVSKINDHGVWWGWFFSFMVVSFNLSPF